jgi:class 3 adenylate cyclase
LGTALTTLVLLALLSTALAIHLSWSITAERNIAGVVSLLNGRTVDEVRREIETTFRRAEGAVEIGRSIFFQGTIDPEDEAKREFVFLSILRSEPSLSWVGFGFPDGRFFGAHRTPAGQIEMVEVGTRIDWQRRHLRRDVYDPLPGDIFFRARITGESAYEAGGTPWYLGARDAAPRWTMVTILPSGFEPAAVVSTSVNMFGKARGVMMASISFSRLSAFLAGLDAAEAGTAIVTSPTGQLIATSTRDSRSVARLADYQGPHAQALRRALQDPAEGTMTSDGVVYTGRAALGTNDWSLITAISRTAFTAEIDSNFRRLIMFVLALSALAAATAVIFARLLIVRPFRRIGRQLDHVAAFRLDAVDYTPSRIVELDELSQELKRMAGGLSAFGRYIPTELVRRLLAKGIAPRPSGEVREITVMFADLPRFTTLSEKLGLDVAPFLTAFLSAAIDAVHAEGGTVDKFIGDAVMAFWNAPLDEPDHVIKACRAAERLREAMRRIPRPDGSPSMPAVRIGINTGPAILGNVGSAERLSYTAIGDTVNVASRLEALAKEHAVEILIGEDTAARVAHEMPVRPVGTVMIRGRQQALMAFELVMKAGTVKRTAVRA